MEDHLERETQVNSSLTSKASRVTFHLPTRVRWAHLIQNRLKVHPNYVPGREENEHLQTSLSSPQLSSAGSDTFRNDLLMILDDGISFPSQHKPVL